MEKSKIAQLVSIILKLIFIIGIISLFFIPILYDTFSGIEITEFSKQTLYYKITFYLCALGGLAIIYQLVKVFNDVYKGSPFNNKTVINLKVIAVLFMILSVMVSVKVIFISTVVSMTVSLVTFIASLSFYVLSQVFKAAVKYKDEVDYTV